MDYSRLRQDDNSQGGTESIYIFEFVKYTRSQITVVNDFLTVFPATTIYKIEADSISFDEDVTDSYEQKISFQVNKILSSDKFKNLALQDFRVIIKDNNNNLRLIGLYTGLSGNFTKTLGTNLSDFNGYNFNFTTKEENTATYLTDLSLFTIG
jgi:hypothetical protein